ncbi:carbohydrate kinase family protein [Candidatus Uhrbacteria bacterium]|nr:carbohydrate kinase family protein [Candidatus Uhrbacteria bacterium]
MYDVITIGAATEDVFLVNRNFTLVRSKKFSTGVGECFAFGSKVDIQDMMVDTGGGATNAAVTFRNLGFRVAALTRLGDDDAGKLVWQDLEERGVDTSLIITDAKRRTGYSTVLLSGHGDRTILVYRGASAHFNSQEIPWHRLYTKWFYVSSLSGNERVLKAVFADAKKRGARVAWNPGRGELRLGLRRLRAYLAETDVLILNRDEAAMLTGQRGAAVKKVIKALGARVRGMVAITDGAKGAYLWTPRAVFFAEKYGKPAVNTTGAGDAFGSALTAAVAKGLDVKDALRLAMMNSGSVVAQMGAKHGLLPSMPTLTALRRVKIKKLGE